jgi:hypothetical protein
LLTGIRFTGRARPHSDHGLHRGAAPFEVTEVALAYGLPDQFRDRRVVALRTGVKRVPKMVV